LEHLAQHELDLSVQAPELIVGPRLQRIEDRRIDAKQERLALSHEPPPSPARARRTAGDQPPDGGRPVSTA